MLPGMLSVKVIFIDSVQLNNLTDASIHSYISAIMQKQMQHYLFPGSSHTEDLMLILRQIWSKTEKEK